MLQQPIFQFLFAFLFCIVSISNSHACSMYKVTSNGKTMVGCNEDAWRTTPHIWFEPANADRPIGATFTGSRVIGPNLYAPQSGMNEKGLAYSRLASYHPVSMDELPADILTIERPDHFLKDVLHHCSTVEKVQAYVSRYDRSLYIDDVFIYVDRSGKYLVVEPYKAYIDSNDAYVLANFCPSITSENAARMQDRYRNGREFVAQHGIEASLAYCRQMSDTMHVCRSKVGDGTLLTSIWDTDEQKVHLYFYHNYENKVTFDLPSELAKGDHTFAMQDLFPPSEEFTHLEQYVTPFNTPSIRIGLAIAGVLIALLSCLLAFLLFFRNKDSKQPKSLWIWIVLGLAFSYYAFILATNIGIYYFPSPYDTPMSTLVSTFSYYPFGLILLFPFLVFIHFKWIKNLLIPSSTKWITGFLNGFYLLMLLSFFYWGLF